MKAFSYLRVSGLGQDQKRKADEKDDGKGDGIKRQREVVTQYAARNEIQIEQEFIDRLSGTKDGFDREGLDALFVAIRANGVRMVLVENADRLARDLMVSEIILKEFRELGVKVVACDSGTDLTVEDGEPTRKLIRQILGAISEFDKTRIVQKLKAARERRRKAGLRCEGKKPFGATDAERETLDKMRAYRKRVVRENPMTYAAIANQLNTDGLRPRHGNKWHKATVQRILARQPAAV
jgi:DNA invertase Pin-like site-specific DNA recombinase